MNTPLAETRNLLVQRVDGETLVYDTRRNRVHCLSPAAARIWRACDGTRAAADLTAFLDPPAGSSGAAAALVEELLARLKKARLITASGVEPECPARRDLLRRAGIAALATTAVASIVAPLPAQAGTCLGNNAAACNIVTVGQCCQNKKTCTPNGINFQCNGAACVCT